MKNPFENQQSLEPDETDEQVFNQYVTTLDLKQEDLAKKMLDVGADTGQFAKWVREHIPDSDVYSLEPREGALLEKTKSAIGKADKIPFPDESFELIVSHAAIPNVISGSPMHFEKKIRQTFAEILRVLKLGGEIRLAPVLKWEKYEGKIVTTKLLDEALDHLRDASNVEVVEIPMPERDQYEYEGHQKTDQLMARAYRIIIKKKGK